MDYQFGQTPGVVKSTYGSRGQGEQFGVEIAKPIKKGPEYNIWFWNPGKPIVQRAPEWFRKQVKAIDESLEVTWSPLAERWLVFTRAEHFRTPICAGWRLLFVHHDENRNYLPLDERLLARLYLIDSTRNGGSKAYFDRIVSEYERDQEKKRKDRHQDAIDRAMPYWDHSQIKNIGQGNKFSTFFA